MVRYKFEFLLFKLILKIIKIVPEKSRFKMAEILGILTYKLIKKRRMITLGNLKLAFPGMSLEKREEIALDSYKILGKAFLSTLWFETYLKEEKNVVLEGKEHLEKAINNGNGAILAVMHMGNMEAILKFAYKYKVITVAKKQKNPYLDKYITESREKLNITLLKKSRKTSFQLMKYLHQNNVIGLFSDQRDNGSNVEFFGENTIAPTGAVSLALKNKVPLFLAYNIMHSDNTCTAHISKEINLINTGNFKEDVHTNVQNLIYKMEKIITKHPEQWMWCHDRWSIYKKIKNFKEEK
ncbi:MAG: lysophospholipid acyltransferase family protein [Fusobacteriaceae bacterium]